MATGQKANPPKKVTKTPEEIEAAKAKKAEQARAKRAEAKRIKEEEDAAALAASQANQGDNGNEGNGNPDTQNNEGSEGGETSETGATGEGSNQSSIINDPNAEQEKYIAAYRRYESTFAVKPPTDLTAEQMLEAITSHLDTQQSNDEAAQALREAEAAKALTVGLNINASKGVKLDAVVTPEEKQAAIDPFVSDEINVVIVKGGIKKKISRITWGFLKNSSEGWKEVPNTPLEVQKLKGKK